MGKVAKAIAAAISALIGSLAAQLEAVESISAISDLGFVLIAGATFGAFVAVYLIPNTPAPPAE